MIDFVRRLIRLRKDYPLLHRDRFVHGEEQFEPSGFSDIQWLRSDGEPMQDADWHIPGQNVLGMLLAAEAGAAAPGGTRLSALVIVFNAGTTALEFKLPVSEHHWRCLLTTADSAPAVNQLGCAAIEARSVQLFELQV